jgi:hypothetical protein
MKLPLPIMTILLTALPAFAQESWVGFKPVEDVNLSFKSYMENSIVLMDTVGDVDELKENGFEIVDINTVNEVTNLKKLAANTDPTQPQKNLKAIQIETCRKQKLRFCPVVKCPLCRRAFLKMVNDLILVGTAFTIGWFGLQKPMTIGRWRNSRRPWCCTQKIAK